MQLGWGAAGMGVPSPQPRGRAGTGRGSGPPSEPLQIRPFSAFPPPRPPGQLPGAVVSGFEWEAWGCPEGTGDIWSGTGGGVEGVGGSAWVCYAGRIPATPLPVDRGVPLGAEVELLWEETPPSPPNQPQGPSPSACSPTLCLPPSLLCTPPLLFPRRQMLEEAAPSFSGA